MKRDTGGDDGTPISRTVRDQFNLAGPPFWLLSLACAAGFSGKTVADLVGQPEIGEGLAIGASLVDAGHGAYDEFGGGDGDPAESYAAAGFDLAGPALGSKFGVAGSLAGDSVSDVYQTGTQTEDS